MGTLRVQRCTVQAYWIEKLHACICICSWYCMYMYIRACTCICMCACVALFVGSLRRPFVCACAASCRCYIGAKLLLGARFCAKLLNDL